jgi:hypothetical protein
MTLVLFANSLRGRYGFFAGNFGREVYAGTMHQQGRATIMNQAVSNQPRQLFERQRRSVSGRSAVRHGARAGLAAVLGRIAAGILLVVLVLSVVVNVRYGLVARQHALLTAASIASQNVSPASNPV